MTSELSDISTRLSVRGWLVKLAQWKSIPDTVLARYPWLPAENVSFMRSFESIVSPDEKSWFVTFADLLAESDSAFAWNQWEIDSLAAADGDIVWQKAIRAFWDKHFPILLSVRSGYSYVAIRDDLEIVSGREPEFEETEYLAATLRSFLEMIANGDSRLDRPV